VCGRGYPAAGCSWLLSRGDDEVVLRLTPHRIVSWDYRARMADAL
jgi:hypothetical protein